MIATSTDVPLGYKRTEVGVIPDDWDVKYLKDISPRQSVGLVINPSTYFDDSGDVPMLVGSNINEDSISWESANRITVASNLSIPASRIYAGDLVMVRVGEPGVTAVVPPELNGCNCASMMIVRQHRSFNSQWLCYVMNSWVGRGQVEHVQYGTAQKQFNISDAIDFRYPVPTRAEQEAIAEALGDADALIESLEQLVAKKRHLKQAAMQQLLTGKKRLPGFEAKEGYKQTDVGLIPKDWNPKTVGEITTKVGSGITPRGGNSNYRDFGRPFVRSQNVGWGMLQLDDLVFIDDATHATFSATELIANDVLLNITGASIGRCSVADTRVAGGNVNQHVCIIRVHPSAAEPRFLQYVLLSRIGQRQIDSFQAGGNREGLNFGQIRSMQIPLPPTVTEQEAISEIVSDMDAEIEAIEAKLAKARQIKQGMMQELLTGRTRLVEPTAIESG